MDNSNHILVTGGAGYIGSHMTLGLLAAGERPLVVDNLSTGLRAAVPAAVPFFQGDCGDADFVGRILDRYPVDAIIHFAASIVVPDSVVHPLAYYKNNTVNARALIDCAVRRGIPHFVFSSTAAVYGERFADGDGRLRATFDMVWLAGWAPHESQQKPLKPGSAKMRLEDALRGVGKGNG